MTAGHSTMDAEILRFIANAVVVVAGWWVVNKLAARRDLTKARREIVAKEVDALFDRVNELIQQAVAYHENTARDRSVEDAMKMELQDVSSRISALAKVSEQVAVVHTCRSKLIQFKRACTGEHFEDEHEGPCEAGSPIIEKIAASGLGLKRELMNVKLGQFGTER